MVQFVVTIVMTEEEEEEGKIFDHFKNVSFMWANLV